MFKAVAAEASDSDNDGGLDWPGGVQLPPVDDKLREHT